jgi:hypothetical protein
MLTRRELLGLCLAFLITLPAVTSRLYASDEVEYFAWLRSVAFDHDVNFRNEYQYFFDAGVSRSTDFHETFLERTNELGRPVNYATPGPGLLWAPFYAVGHVVALVTGAPRDGFSHPYIAAIAYGSACYAFLATLLGALIARRVFGRGLAASLAVAAGTPLLFYGYIAPGYGHAASAFAVSLFVWVWLRVRERWSISGAVALGLSAGFIGFVREQDVFLAIGPAIDFLATWLGRGRGAGAGMRSSPIAVGAAGTAAFAAGIAPLFLAYKALNGHYFTTETAARKMTWTAPHVWSVLFDLEHGLFAWTPLALLAIAGLVIVVIRGRVWDATHDSRDRDAPRIALIALIMMAAQAYSSGSVESWTVAGSFGQRRFVAITPMIVLGLAALLVHVRHARANWRRWAVRAAIGLCIWWNLGLMAQFGLNRMDRQKLTLEDNARMTFLELPLEAPRLAWRYFTDRQSLYKLPRQ